jgi:hypothetical protein
MGTDEEKAREFMEWIQYNYDEQLYKEVERRLGSATLTVAVVRSALNRAQASRESKGMSTLDFGNLRCNS